MSETKTEEPTVAATAKSDEEPVESKTPTKRTPKRKADAFQKESEELLKNLGVSVDMEDGRRRTRSSARGVTATPPTTPATPPAKRARGSSTTPKRGRGHPEDDDREAEGQELMSTPKKRGILGPKKLAVLVEDVAKKDEASGVDRADSVKEQKDTKEKETDATGVTSSSGVADEKPVKVHEAKEESQLNETKNAEEAGKKDEPSPVKVVESKQHEKLDADKSSRKPDDRKSNTDVTTKDESIAENVEAVVEAKPTDEPMEVDGQDTKSSTVADVTTKDESSKVTVEAKQDTDVVVVIETKQDAETVEHMPNAQSNEVNTESNGKGDSAAVRNTPAKEVASAGVTEEGKKEAVEGCTIQESDKTTASSVAVNNVETAAPTAINVVEKVSTNVESKIVTNESTVVEPATAT